MKQTLNRSTLLYEIGADFACSAKCPVRPNLRDYIVLTMPFSGRNFGCRIYTVPLGSCTSTEE